MDKTGFSMPSYDSNEFEGENTRQDQNSGEHVTNLAVSEEVIEKLSKDIDNNPKNSSKSKMRVIKAIANHMFGSIAITPKNIEHSRIDEEGCFSKENDFDFESLKKDFPGNASTAMEEEYKSTVEDIESSFVKLVEQTEQKNIDPCKTLKSLLLNCLKSNPRESLSCSEISEDFMKCVNKHRFDDTDRIF